MTNEFVSFRMFFFFFCFIKISKKIKKPFFLAMSVIFFLNHFQAVNENFRGFLREQLRHQNLERNLIRLPADSSHKRIMDQYSYTGSVLVQNPISRKFTPTCWKWPNPY